MNCRDKAGSTHTATGIRPDEAGGRKMDTRMLSFRAALDARPVSKYQIRLVALAVALLIMDGYDTQAIGYVAPVLSGLWHIDRGGFGPIFSAGLIGLTIGTLVFAPISDKVGCRPILIGCTILYGALTLATALADSWNTLLLLRFLTGLGLGGAMPSTIALVSDYSPTRHRNLLVTVAVCGFALGGAIGGFVAAATIHNFGWQSIFILGGIVPLVTLPLLMSWLPESLPRLLTDPAPRQRLAKVVADFVPGWDISKVETPASAAAKERFPVAALFNSGYAIQTLLIWVIFFSNLLLLYFFVNWIPTVATSSGQSLQAANLTAGIFQLSGIFGALVLAYISDRLGRPQLVLAFTYAGAALCCYLFGSAAGSTPAILVASAAASGFCIVGAQGVVNAFAGNYYPAAIRATGVGWALGIGRLGSILGPLVGGILISLHVTTPTLFALFAIPAILATISASLVKRSPDHTLADEVLVRKMPQAAPAT
jgi:AAHS family 4-hydroxybenzoate transporter-like MFS transporter